MIQFLLITIILIQVFVFVGAIFFGILTKKKVKNNNSPEESLTKVEKAIVIVLCIFNPVLTGAILHYGWKSVLPSKAKQVNNIAIIIITVGLILSTLIGVLFGLLFPDETEEILQFTGQIN